MTAIFTSDLHLADRPIDEYRWSIFPWLREKVIDLNIDVVVVGGDITERKDNHPSSLVNRLMDELSDLALITDIIILAGNHDRIDPANPYFRFSSKVGDGRVEFIHEPTLLYLPIERSRKKIPCWFLPCTSNPVRDWDGIDFNTAKFVFCHQTFEGAEAENGQRLTGCPPSIFKGFRGLVWSGDIHVPQTIGHKIHYIGSPYLIRFGDSFIPRLVYVDKQGQKNNIQFPCLQKHLVVIRSLDELDEFGKPVRKGDQVKLRMLLRRSEYPQWPQFKQQIIDYAKTKDWWLCGLEPVAIETNTEKQEKQKQETKTIDPTTLVKDYAIRNKADNDLTEVGLGILTDIN